MRFSGKAFYIYIADNVSLHATMQRLTTSPVFFLQRIVRVKCTLPWRGRGVFLHNTGTYLLGYSKTLHCCQYFQEMPLMFYLESEADKAHARFCYYFEAAVSSHKCLELFRQTNLSSDMLLEPLNPVKS